MSDDRQRDQHEQHRPGQVVGGHVLNEDGTQWLPLARPHKASSRPGGLNRTLLVWLVVGGLLLVGGLAYTSLSLWVPSNTVSSPSAKPSPSAPVWLPAFNTWIEEVAGALDHWDAGAKPLKDYHTIGTGVTMVHPPDLWEENHRTMADAVDQMYRVADSAPSAVPEDITSQMTLIAQAYKAKYAAYRDVVATYGSLTSEARSAEEAALARLDQASRQAENAMAAMWDALIAYWPGAEGSPPAAI